jgi:hypothetical protein
MGYSELMLATGGRVWSVERDEDYRRGRREEDDERDEERTTRGTRIRAANEDNRNYLTVIKMS